MTLKFYDDGTGNSYTAMGVPAQLTTSNVTSSSADLTLPSAVTGAQHYELSESADGGSTWTVVDSAIAPGSIVSPATYSRSGLTSGATYQWRLRAKFASLVSPGFSVVQSAVTQASVTAPAAPVLGTPTVTSSSVTAVVINGNGAASFETRVSYDGGSTYSTPVSGLTVPGISASTSGILEVRGLASGGAAGAWSSTVSFTTSAAATVIMATGDIVNDGFESGDLTSPGNNGFAWKGQRFTSLVTMDPATGYPTVIYTATGTTTNNVLTGDTRDWTALSGSNSMRFDFVAGTDPGVFAEQDFGLVGRAETTIWMRFALRVPLNYIHVNVPQFPGQGYSGSDNNKLFFLWMDGYSAKGDGSSVGMEFRPDGSQGSIYYVKLSSGRYTGGSGDQQYLPFISVPNDRGRWMYLCVKIVAESVVDASDGTVDIWRRWQNEAVWSKQQSLINQPIRIPTAGPNGFANGYLMGANNSGYANNTEFLLDDFVLSTTSLL